MRDLRRGWYLGTDTFRDKLMNLLDEATHQIIKKGSVTGAVVKAHKEADAERLMERVAKELGYPMDEDSPEQERRGAWQKCLLAGLVKKHCQVSNQWLSKRLAMGHPAGMSKVTKLYQDSEEGRKSIKHHEKILVSKDWYHPRPATIRRRGLQPLYSLTDSPLPKAIPSPQMLQSTQKHRRNREFQACDHLT